MHKYLSHFIRSFALVAVAVSSVLLGGNSVQAAVGVRAHVTYQARLMDTLGAPVADGVYQIEFSLYDAAVAGTRLWTADGTLVAPLPVNVTVQDGLFTVLLGDGVTQLPFENIDWNSDSLYLGVTVGADAEMTPRRPITAVPQAINSSQLSGMSPSSTDVYGGETLFTLYQASSTSATATRSVLDLRTNGTSSTADYFLRGISPSGTALFSVNSQGQILNRVGENAFDFDSSPSAASLGLTSYMYSDSAISFFHASDTSGSHYSGLAFFEDVNDPEGSVGGYIFRNNQTNEFNVFNSSGDIVMASFGGDLLLGGNNLLFNGLGVCLDSGVNCPAATATLQDIYNNGQSIVTASGPIVLTVSSSQENVLSLFPGIYGYSPLEMSYSSSVYNGGLQLLEQVDGSTSNTIGQALMFSSNLDNPLGFISGLNVSTSSYIGFDPQTGEFTIFSVTQDATASNSYYKSIAFTGNQDSIILTAGNVDISGQLTENGIDICLQNGGNCASATTTLQAAYNNGQYVSTTNGAITISAGQTNSINNPLSDPAFESFKILNASSTNNGGVLFAELADTASTTYGQGLVFSSDVNHSFNFFAGPHPSSTSFLFHNQSAGTFEIGSYATDTNNGHLVSLAFDPLNEVTTLIGAFEVQGNANITGSLTQLGVSVCLQDGTNCSSSTGTLQTAYNNGQSIANINGPVQLIGAVTTTIGSDDYHVLMSGEFATGTNEGFDLAIFASSSNPYLAGTGTALIYREDRTLAPGVTTSSGIGFSNDASQNYLSLFAVRPGGQAQNITFNVNGFTFFPSVGATSTFAENFALESTARVDSDLIPRYDAAWKLGSDSLRWDAFMRFASSTYQQITASHTAAGYDGLMFLNSSNQPLNTGLDLLSVSTGTEDGTFFMFRKNRTIGNEYAGIYPYYNNTDNYHAVRTIASEGAEYNELEISATSSWFKGDVEFFNPVMGATTTFTVKNGIIDVNTYDFAPGGGGDPYNTFLHANIYGEPETKGLNMMMVSSTNSDGAVFFYSNDTSSSTGPYTQIGIGDLLNDGANNGILLQAKQGSDISALLISATSALYTGEIIPFTDGAHSIGLSNYRWDAYLDQLNVGTSSTNVNNQVLIGYDGTSRAGLCINDTSAVNDCPGTPGASIEADGSITANAFDLAETYETSDNLEPGDIVVASTINDLQVVRSSNTTTLPMGIVSTAPGLQLGFNKEGAHPIALAGRVPTKVSTINGEIKAGDLLAPTTIPGVAGKAIEDGPIVGIALQSYNGADIGKIEVFVKTSWYSKPNAAQQVVENNTYITNITTSTPETVYRGLARIDAGSKVVHIEFKSLMGYPHVQVTPKGLIVGSWSTDNYTDTGFDIILEQEQTFDAVFNWEVRPIESSTMMILSDGTKVLIDALTGQVIVQEQPALPVSDPTSTTTEPILPPIDETVTPSTTQDIVTTLDQTTL